MSRIINIIERKQNLLRKINESHLQYFCVKINGCDLIHFALNAQSTFCCNCEIRFKRDIIRTLQQARLAVFFNHLIKSTSYVYVISMNLNV